MSTSSSSAPRSAASDRDQETLAPVEPTALLASLEPTFFERLSDRDRARWAEHEATLTAVGADPSVLFGDEDFDRALDALPTVRRLKKTERGPLYAAGEWLQRRYVHGTRIEQRWDIWDKRVPAGELKRRTRVLRDRAAAVSAAKADLRQEHERFMTDRRELNYKIGGLEETVRLQAEALGRAQAGESLASVQAAIRALVAFVPTRVPASVLADMTAHEERTVPPFGTEAFLYPLLGKDDARVFLRLLKEMAQAAGLSYRDLLRELDERSHPDSGE